MTTGHVQILLSTYNGQRYLVELMDSVLSQDYRDFSLLIRDDGSTDATLPMLDNYRSHPHLHIVHGHNLGAINSFFALLAMSSASADYIALCDQDDVWAPDKLSRAVSHLAALDTNTPALYCSRRTLVDENLLHLGLSDQPRHPPAFANALVENIAAGCTIVLNAAARRLLLQHIPSSPLMHDAWMYLVISALGQVIYDAEPRILYRQHAANVIGEHSTFVGKWRKKIQRFLGWGGVRRITKQAQEFSDAYANQLAPAEAAVLHRFLHGRSTPLGRLWYALTGATFRQDRVDNLIFRALIMLNRI